MGVKFEQTAYVKAVKENTQLQYDTSIFQHSKKNFKFQTCSITVQKFNEKYVSSGWFGRKIIALPCAVWSGVVKTIYHLTKAILVGLIKATYDHGKYLKVQCFYVVRDLQESFGWVISIFNDRYGQYHIQESKFHKSCYDCTSANKIDSADPQPSYINYPPRSDYTTGSTPVVSQGINSYLNSSHEGRQVYTTSSYVSFPPSSDYSTGVTPVVNQGIYSYLNPSHEGRQAYTTSFPVSSGNQPKVAVSASEKAVASISEIDKLDEEFKKIEKAPYNQDKEKRFAVLAEAYLTQNNPEKALITIKKLHSDTTTKESIIQKISDFYYAKGGLDAALSTIKIIYSNTQIKELQLAKISLAYLKRGDQEKAVVAIKNITRDTQTKESCIAKIAKDYLDKGKPEKALETIKLVIHDTKMKESTIVIIAENYLARGNQVKALSTIKNVYHDHKCKEAFIEKITESYFVKGDLDAALKTIKEIFQDHQAKESHLSKIANAYMVKGDREKALTTIQEIFFNSQIKIKLILQLARSYFNAKDENGILMPIKEILKAVIINTFISNRKNDLYMAVYKKNILTLNIIDNFLTELAKDCYQETKNYYAESFTEELILKKITEIATKETTLEAYLAL